MKKTMQKQLNWEVVLQPVRTKTGILKDRVALTRNDNGQLLGVRSDRYRPFFNRELELLVQRIAAKPGFEFKGYEEFRDGKRILAFFKNTQKNFLLCGEKVDDYLIIGNSHDASSKLFVATSNYMFRCQNQFSEKIRAFEQRHTKGLNSDDIQIEELIATYEEGRRALYQKMERLQKVKIDLDLIHHLACELLETEKETDTIAQGTKLVNSKKNVLFLNCIEQEIKVLGPTLWGLFNGITKYTSNHLKGMQGFGTTNGSGEEMNRKALKFCMKQLQMKDGK
jgi:exonuclease VII small subunit